MPLDDWIPDGTSSTSAHMLPDLELLVLVEGRRVLVIDFPGMILQPHLLDFF